MRGGVANALDSRDFGNVLDDQGQICDFFAASHRATVGIDVLPKQCDFLDALRREAGDFREHIIERT